MYYCVPAIFLSDDGEWSSWSDWFCGCDDNVRTRARTCEDSIPASGLSVNLTSQRWRLSSNLGSVSEQAEWKVGTQNKTFSIHATTHHKQAIDGGSTFGTGASNITYFCLPSVAMFLCVNVILAGVF